MFENSFYLSYTSDLFEINFGTEHKGELKCFTNKKGSTTLLANIDIYDVNAIENKCTCGV